MFLLLFVVNDEKIVSSNNQWAQDQLASIDFKSSLMFVLSILRLFRNAIELQTVSQKCLMNSVLHFYVCLLSLLSFKMVLMTLMLVLMEVCFSLLYAEWHIWIPTSVIECWLKCEKKKKKTERGSVPLSVFPLLREGAATRWLRAFVGSAKLKCLYPFTGKHSAWITRIRRKRCVLHGR